MGLWSILSILLLAVNKNNQLHQLPSLSGDLFITFWATCFLLTFSASNSAPGPLSLTAGLMGPPDRHHGGSIPSPIAACTLPETVAQQWSTAQYHPWSIGSTRISSFYSCQGCWWVWLLDLTKACINMNVDVHACILLLMYTNVYYTCAKSVYRMSIIHPIVMTSDVCLSFLSHGFLNNAESVKQENKQTNLQPNISRATKGQHGTIWWIFCQCATRHGRAGS